MDTLQQREHGVTATISHFVKNLLDTGRIKRAAAAIWMNALVGAVVVIAALLSGLRTPASEAPTPSWSVRAVTVFAIWLLSFVPGWLYIRFLGLRADALWNEYVLNLYRLGLDEPEWLPPPPAESAYVRLPGATEGGEEKTNIYRQKFNAYYGRKVSARSTDSESCRVSVDTLFPVFLCTVTLTVAWTATLWNPAVVISPVEPWATLEFGFLGAYAFAVSLLVRRFYQSDLRPSAYAAVVLRIIVVLLTLAVLHQLFAIEGSDGSVAHAAQYVTAFVVGFFPLAGLQALQRVAAKVLRVVLPQIAPEYPLEQVGWAQHLVRGPPGRGGRGGHAEPHHDESRGRHPAYPRARRAIDRLDRPGLPSDSSRPRIASRDQQPPQRERRHGRRRRRYAVGAAPDRCPLRDRPAQGVQCQRRS